MIEYILRMTWKEIIKLLDVSLNLNAMNGIFVPILTAFSETNFTSQTSMIAMSKVDHVLEISSISKKDDIHTKFTLFPPIEISFYAQLTFNYICRNCPEPVSEWCMRNWLGSRPFIVCFHFFFVDFVHFLETSVEELLDVDVGSLQCSPVLNICFFSQEIIQLYDTCSIWLQIKTLH